MTWSSAANRARLPIDQLSSWAIIGAVCGALAAIGPLPPVLKAPLLMALVFLGPGSAALQYWAGDLPAVAVRALVPVLGLALVFLVLTGSLLLGYWNPRVLLLGIAVATAGVGAANHRRSVRSGRSVRSVQGGGADDRTH